MMDSPDITTKLDDDNFLQNLNESQTYAITLVSIIEPCTPTSSTRIFVPVIGVFALSPFCLNVVCKEPAS